MNRRTFLAASGSLALMSSAARRSRAAVVDKPALLGGKPVRTEPFPGWPPTSAPMEQAVAQVVRSGNWYRNGNVETFENRYADMNSAKYCVATSSGTTALFTSLGALGVGPGDEVIVPPFTFMATVSVVLLHHALPVFVDSDPETFLMDPGKLEAVMTDRTKAVVPVHIGGNVADLDRIGVAAQNRKIPIVGDACQAHLAEWKGKSAGSWGTTGCYSFQLSKNLCSGEGGAIITNDEAAADACFAFHNCVRRRSGARGELQYRGGRNGNFRMTEFQAAVLLSQLPEIEARAATRSENGAYLTSLLQEIPGIRPARMYDGCTRNAYHLYMFRYSPEAFAGLSRNGFVKALRAEGIPCSPGYDPLNKAGFIRDALSSPAYRRVYGDAELARWAQRCECPENDKLCAESVWLYQTTLLAERSAMDQIAEAVRKIHAHAAALASA